MFRGHKVYIHLDATVQIHHLQRHSVKFLIMNAWWFDSFKKPAIITKSTGQIALGGCSWKCECGKVPGAELQPG